jgi:hypothetical protein
MATAAKKTDAPKGPENLAIWNALSKTDPAHTKGFKRAGGFTGTAIKPIWIVKMLTELFGPCGKGWGMDPPTYQLVPGENRELLVYCTVSGWYVEDGERCQVVGVGGDKAIVYIKANEQYNRPERWENDDEAFKKAFTDAVGNAFKFLDMGLFEDSKYLEQTRAEFAANDTNGHSDKIPGITKIKERLRSLMTAGDAAPDLDSFNALVSANADDLTKIKDAHHSWWTGDGEDFEGYRAWIKRRREELSASEDGAVVNGLIESMKQCETTMALTNWRAANEEVIDALDGAEGRKFELAWSLHESAIREVEKVHN